MAAATCSGSDGSSGSNHWMFKVMPHLPAITLNLFVQTQRPCRKVQEYKLSTLLLLFEFPLIESVSPSMSSQLVVRCNVGACANTLDTRGRLSRSIPADCCLLGLIESDPELDLFIAYNGFWPIRLNIKHHTLSPKCSKQTLAYASNHSATSSACHPPLSSSA